MADFGLFLTFARELLLPHHQSRGAPPSSTLEIDTIRAALREGGNSSGRYAAGYLFHTARVSQTIYGSKRCLDLGAAPGCQLLQVAKLLPQTEFLGIDRSASLIGDGETESLRQQLNNVEWVSDDITTLAKFQDNSVDAVISTMTLHDLTSIDQLRCCLENVARVLRPGGAIYIEDYARLKSPASIEYFNNVNQLDEPDAFSHLNACSLKAAFTIDELRDSFSTHLPQTKLYSTFLTPFLNVATTSDRQLPQPIVNTLKEMRQRLSPKKKTDLDDLRLFFRLGGWKNDPFA